MNTTTSTSIDPTAPPPPPPLQPPRSSFSCDRHPEEQFSGFCPSCLCERLTTLDPSSLSNTPSSSRRPSSASAAIKALFSSKPLNNFPPKPSKPTSLLPELRRTKSFSASKNEAALGLFNFEPQRKSCDVRVRNTLSSLFTLDNKPKPASSSHQNPQINITKGIESSSVANKAVLEEAENEDDFRDPEYIENSNDEDGDGDEIRPHSEVLVNAVELDVDSGEIVEEEDEVSVFNLKPMKDHIDLDSQEKKSSGGGFWSAASVFSKKWQSWRRKQKTKKQSNGPNLATLPVEKPIGRQFRETQSEIADYGFGRRSCDTDPRFSLDVGRISFDGPRYSFDEPRASWDGHLIGRTFPRMAPPMVSVLEDPPAAHVSRSDMQIPVEEPTVNEDEGVPGGSTQTKEYYLDSSSSRRRKSLDRSSLDRSSSIRKTAAAVVAEVDELKIASNAKVVSPTRVEYFPVLGLRDSNSNSLRDDLSETFELSSGFRESINSVMANGDRKDPKKSRRWSWRIWGFIQRRKEDEEEEKYGRANGVERSLSESWQEMRREGNGDNMRVNRNMFRSNSSVSWRHNANGIGGSFGSSVRKSNVEMNGKKRNGFVLERNRSARYSPDNGLLRFYLTPLRGSRRGGLGKPTSSHSIARSVLRLF